MATRFYLPSTGSAAVSPAYDAGWEKTDIAARLPAVTTKTSSAMTTLSTTDGGQDNEDHLYRQYISDQIAAQTISAQTLEFQIRASEDDAKGDLYTAIGVRVVSYDGNTVRGTILAVSRDATEVATSLTNRRYTATTTEVTAEDGDRIVIEIGLGGDPWGSGYHSDGNLRIGDAAASDLPENDTDTNDYNPWVEFPNTLSWYSGPTILSIEDSYHTNTSGSDLELWSQQVIEYDFETGELPSFSSTWDIGDLAVNANAALADTNYGLEVTVDSVASYGQVSLPSLQYDGDSTWHARIYVDRNTFSQGDSGIILLVRFLSAAGACFAMGIKASTHDLVCYVTTDSGANYSGVGATPLPTGEHYLELVMKRATNSSSSDGYGQLYLDGESVHISTSRDNYDRCAGGFTSFQIGAYPYVYDAGANSFYLDQLVINNTGETIGPHTGGATNLTIESSWHTNISEDVALTKSDTLVIEESFHTNISEDAAITKSDTLVVGESFHTNISEDCNASSTAATDLVIEDSYHTNIAEDVALTKSDTLVIEDSYHTNIVEDCNVTTIINLAIESSWHTDVSEDVALTKSDTLVIEESLHTNIAEDCNVTTTINLSVESSWHTNIADSVAITKQSTLVVEEGFHTNISEACEVSSADFLTIEDSFHTNVADAVLITKQSTLTIEESFHANIAESVSITKQSTLVIEGSYHQSTVEDVLITKQSTLVVEESFHTNVSEDCNIFTAGTLSIEDSYHSLVSDDIALTKSDTLAIEDSYHTNIAEDCQVTVTFNLVIEESYHTNAGEDVALSTTYILTIEDSYHTNTAENCNVLSLAALVIEDSYHTNVADSVAITKEDTLVIGDSYHTLFTEDIGLLFGALLDISDSYHTNIVEDCALSIGFVLDIEDSYHVVGSDYLTTTTALVLSIRDSYHALISGEIDFAALFIFLTLYARSSSLHLEDRDLDLRLHQRKLELNLPYNYRK